MTNAVCTEIAESSLLPGILEEDFLGIAGRLEKDFHALQAGFIDTELVKDGQDGRFFMIQHWKSAAMAKDASRRMMKDPSTSEFREALDTKTIRIRYCTQTGRWACAPHL